MGKYREVKKGEQFGCWTALGECEHRGRLLYDKCQCECGTIKFVHHDHLIHGRTTNCGCKMYEVRSKNGKMNKRHGMEGTRQYKIYTSAKGRCNCKTNGEYNNYGGRGIAFEWNSFDEFRNDMGDSYIKHCNDYGEKNTTLDRIDVNGNYCKENCRWATWKEQANNKRTNHQIEYNGVIYKSISMFCESLGLKYQLIRDRLHLGRDITTAIETPLNCNLRRNYVKKKN